MSQKIIGHRLNRGWVSRLLLLGACCVLSGGMIQSAVASGQNMTDAAIGERIKPVGDVYLAGSEPGVAAVPSGPRDGKTVYGTYCSACHNTGISGAPKMGDANAWAPRIAQGRSTLLNHALNGFNAMPAKGTCMDCSEQEISDAIEHMIKDL